jgi:NAD(P)-dependent dehydrogenase (short-subunit alcohol dehydrogenase family)
MKRAFGPVSNGSRIFEMGFGMKKSVSVIGAAGDVGRGVAGQLLQAGYRVTAVGRNLGKLQALQRDLEPLGSIEVLAGSIEDEASTAALVARLQAESSALDGVVVSVNAAFHEMALKAVRSDELLALLQANVVSHLVAAKAMIPLLPTGGCYVAIGGGMADFVVPGMGPVSICQAAQRAMFRILAAEMKDSGVRIHELMLYSMIAGESNRGSHHPKWITDQDVGRHVVAVLQHPEWFPEPILALKSRKEAGQQPIAA